MVPFLVERISLAEPEKSIRTFSEKKKKQKKIAETGQELGQGELSEGKNEPAISHPHSPFSNMNFGLLTWRPSSGHGTRFPTCPAHPTRAIPPILISDRKWSHMLKCVRRPAKKLNSTWLNTTAAFSSSPTRIVPPPATKPANKRQDGCYATEGGWGEGCLFGWWLPSSLKSSNWWDSPAPRIPIWASCPFMKTE